MDYKALKTKGENIAAESTDIIFDKTNFLTVYFNDIINASREILIVSPFVTRRRTLQMIQNLRIALKNGVKVIVVTRPSEDFKEFAVVDQKVSWYGSINLLSFGSAEESIMRLESSNIANELIRSIKKEVEA